MYLHCPCSEKIPWVFLSSIHICIPACCHCYNFKLHIWRNIRITFLSCFDFQFWIPCSYFSLPAFFLTYSSTAYLSLRYFFLIPFLATRQRNTLFPFIDTWTNFKNLSVLIFKVSLLIISFMRALSLLELCSLE